MRGTQYSSFQCLPFAISTQYAYWLPIDFSKSLFANHAASKTAIGAIVAAENRAKRRFCISAFAFVARTTRPCSLKIFSRYTSFKKYDLSRSQERPPGNSSTLMPSADASSLSRASPSCIDDVKYIPRKNSGFLDHSPCTNIVSRYFLKFGIAFFKDSPNG